MESSSIVSFNNDSTFQNTLKSDTNAINVHELALHAMRDRCLLLQKRISVLEKDNMRLKLDIVKTSGTTSQYHEKDLDLHQQITELTKEKSQLLHHVFMVSCENKNLWHKIASIKNMDNDTKEKHPLIRTNTYIHSTPKLSSNQEKFSESSLEEISLKLINSYIQEKSQLVDQYEQMTRLQQDEPILNFDSIGFSYVEDNEVDLIKNINFQLEKMQMLKKELAQQGKVLAEATVKINSILKDGYNCPTCIANGNKIITSEHKEIETSDSLANWVTPQDSTNFNEQLNDIHNNKTDFFVEDTSFLIDKMCPMCGKMFNKDIPFTEFQTHVENHFVGDMEPDSIMENIDENSSFDHL